MVSKAGGLKPKKQRMRSAGRKIRFPPQSKPVRMLIQDEKRRTESKVIAEGRPSYPIKDNKDKILEIPEVTKKEN